MNSIPNMMIHIFFCQHRMTFVYKDDTKIERHIKTKHELSIGCDLLIKP